MSHLRAQYVWGPGDGITGGGADELLCQFDPVDTSASSDNSGGGKPWYILTDAQGDVVSVVRVPNGTNTSAEVGGQWTYSPYGEVLTYEQFHPHPGVVFGHKTLAIDRLDGEALSWDSGTGQLFETRRLVPGARLIGYARNRTLDVRQGRWLQVDPNGSGAVTIDEWKGSKPGKAIAIVDLRERASDGITLQGYVNFNPIRYQDPNGLFSWTKLGEDLTDSNFSVPGPSDILSGAITELASQYSARQMWDVEWASNWDLPDNEHSRTENSWVELALLKGMYDAFEIGFGDYKTNPLDNLVMGSSSGRTTKSRIDTSRGVAHVSGRISVGGCHASVYSRPGGGRSYVLFDDKAVRCSVRVQPSTRAKERSDASRLAGFEKPPVGWVWRHHGTRKGIIQLVPEPLHHKVCHIGRADW